jgi:hypothetical protein
VDEKNADLCWVAREQRNFAPADGVPGEARPSKEESESVTKKSIDLLRTVGCLPVPCGHGAHLRCLTRYVLSTHNRRDDLLRDELTDQSLLSMEREATLGLTGTALRVSQIRHTLLYL